MSVKNNFYISFGVWLVILPFLGIPGLWRSVFIVASGVFLVALSVGPIVLKKLQTKTKIPRKKKESILPPPPENKAEITY